jgi:hypothetical protein
MSDVTGPISSLPGSAHPVPADTMCDNHPDRRATHRIQGETDSFGSEMHDLCHECVEEVRKGPNPTGTCDWCKTTDQQLKPRRDYEEGMCGPVYHVCQGCIDKENKRLSDELDDYDD